ncbi:unnamed protein product [Caenorhabditis brenneri]
MTIQDSGPINVVQTALLSWSNTTVYNKGSHIGLKDADSGDDVLYGNHISNWEDMNKAIYSMTLDYEYSNSKSRRLQIRVHGRSSNPNFLAEPLFSDNTDSCTPRDNTTFVFAYSNDFNSSVVQDVFSTFSKGVSPHYTTFASVRFDDMIGEDFIYTNNWSDIVSYVQTHLPDPSLSFGNNKTGSDVLTRIEQFLGNTHVPVCGSNMLLLVKRMPYIVDVAPIGYKLQQHHSYFTMLVSTSPSGGPDSATLYYLASQTNGVCGFDKDEDMVLAVQIVPSFFNPYLIYAVNPSVSANGTIQLPSLIVPNEVPFGYWFTMTVQDNGPLSVVQVAFWTWLNHTAVNPGFELGVNEYGHVGEWYGNHLGSANILSAVTYDMRLRYAYSDTGVRYLQIRVYGQITSPVDYWPP